MISRSEVSFMSSAFRGTGRSGIKFCTAIGSDVARDTVLGKDMENEELCKLR